MSVRKLNIRFFREKRKNTLQKIYIATLTAVVTFLNLMIKTWYQRYIFPVLIFLLKTQNKIELNLEKIQKTNY